LTYGDRIETWVYSSKTPTDIRRSILPAAEHLLVQKKIRSFHLKPFYIVIYRATLRGRNPTFHLIRSAGSESGNEAAIAHLSKIDNSNVSILIACEYCNS